MNMKNQTNNIQTTLSYYNNYTQEFIQSTRYVNFQTTQDKFLGYLKDDASILDFGCGSKRCGSQEMSEKDERMKDGSI